jgi:hypothetical protein
LGGLAEKEMKRELVYIEVLTIIPHQVKYTHKNSNFGLIPGLIPVRNTVNF